MNGDRVFDALVELLADKVAERLAARAPANDRPEMLTVAAYARRWAISQSTVRHAIAEKRLAVTRIGRSVRIAADAKIGTPAADAATERARLKLLGGGRK